MQQACGRSHTQRVHERRALHPLGDVVPEGVFYLGGFPDAHHDQLAVIESHQNVRLLLGHRHAPDGHPHSHRWHAQSQAAMDNQERGGVRIKFKQQTFLQSNPRRYFEEWPNSFRSPLTSILFFPITNIFQSIVVSVQQTKESHTGLRASKYDRVELSFNKVQQAGSGSKSLNDYF